MTAWRKLGILAGGGDLPVRLALACQSAGRPFFVIRLQGFADEAMDRFPGKTCGLAEFGRILKELRANECDTVCFAGLVRRPKFQSLKPDLKGAGLLAKIVAAARHGDGAMLDALVDAFSNEGFTVIGADEVNAAMTVPSGVLGRHKPKPEDLTDIEKARALINALGPFDVGQGAVVRSGFVLSVEAAEGTDQMLKRCAEIAARLDEGARAGVLVKMPKPEQERRVDLPSIGVATIDGANAARLSGIALEAGGALIIDRDDVIARADVLGLFVYAFEPKKPAP